jgi:hypothetical protein
MRLLCFTDDIIAASEKENLETTRASQLVSPGTMYATRSSMIIPSSSPLPGSNTANSRRPSSLALSSQQGGRISESRKKLASRFSDYQRPDLQSPIPSISGSTAKDASTGAGTHGLPYNWDPFYVSATIEPEIQEELNIISKSGPTEEPITTYHNLIAKYEKYLRSIKELEIVACCVFSMRPSSPQKEKEYIMELFVRRDAEIPFKASSPYGPVGTEWCVISKTWYDSWQFYVGGSSGTLSESRKIQEPGSIDNYVILQKSEGKPLLNGCVIGQQLEIIPPSIYTSFAAWYGGGPKIVRKVAITEGESTGLELYPLCLKVCHCDNKGKTTDTHTERLFSKTSTVAEMLKELCEWTNIDVSRGKIWNYAVTNPAEQRVLPLDITLTDAKLQDGQSILFEICQEDGTWPRSSLQTVRETPTKTSDNGSSTILSGDDSDMHFNSGRVGLDNIGNTCYMNSSLQALAHTFPLTDYFLKQYYLKHINMTSKFGYQGKLAQCYANLLHELWTTDKPSFTPRKFHSEFTALASQFRGHDQHDAQELLASLLDGLSEDLNLVQSKPYIENPDSDDRPDHELADIWWQNHQKRDHSVIQSLFTGQFKSVMTCGCGKYSSARFEAFNFLTLPVPEESERRFTVYVMSSTVTHATECAIRLNTDTDIQEAINKLITLNIPGVDKNSEYLVAEVSNSVVVEICPFDRKVNTIRDSDNVFLYQLVKVDPFKSSTPDVSPRTASNASITQRRNTATQSKNIASLMSNLEKNVSILVAEDTKPAPAPAPSPSTAIAPVKLTPKMIASNNANHPLASLLKTTINGKTYVRRYL